MCNLNSLHTILPSCIENAWTTHSDEDWLKRLWIKLFQPVKFRLKLYYSHVNMFFHVLQDLTYIASLYTVHVFLSLQGYLLFLEVLNVDREVKPSAVCLLSSGTKFLLQETNSPSTLKVQFETFLCFDKAHS